MTTKTSATPPCTRTPTPPSTHHANDGNDYSDESFNAAVSAYEKGEQRKQAWEVLHKTRDRTMIPDVMSLSSAISACKKGDRKEQTASVMSLSAAISPCEKERQ